MNHITKFKKIRPNSVSPAENGSQFGPYYNLYAAIDRTITIYSGYSVEIPTGLVVRMPQDYEMMIYRPVMATSRYISDISLVGSPLIIHSDFTPRSEDELGKFEIKIMLCNNQKCEFEVKPGDKIAEFVLQKRDPNDSPLVEVMNLDSRMRIDPGNPGTCFYEFDHLETEWLN